MAINLRGEAVGRGGEVLHHLAAGVAVLYAVDDALRVLDTDAEGEGLGFEKPAVASEELVDVAGGMARGEDDGLAAVFVALAVAHAADMNRAFAFLRDEIDDAGVEMIFAAVAFDGGTHVGDDAAELVGADVGMGINGDGGVGAVFDEAADDFLHVAAFGAAGVELAVGVGACAALAEAPVAVGVDLLGAGQLGDVGAAFLHRFAALDDDGLEPYL